VAKELWPEVNEKKTELCIFHQNKYTDGHLKIGNTIGTLRFPLQ